MKYLSLLTIFAATVVSSPISMNTAQSAPVVTPEFYLKTSNSHIPVYNQLYVMGYQTGNGTMDVVLTKNNASAYPVYLNGTRALVDMGTSHPWGLILSEMLPYEPPHLGTANNASFDPVVINAGQSHGGFGISNGVVFHGNIGRNFNGWMVCQWNHNMPQLFWMSMYYFIEVPTGCSHIDIHTIPKS